MQRNPDLIRAILLAVDAKPTERLTVPGYTDEVVSYHVRLLHEAGWIEGDTVTWEGYEFLEAFRSDVIWDRAKALALEKTGTVSIDILKMALPIVIEQLVGA